MIRTEIAVLHRDFPIWQERLLLSPAGSKPFGIQSPGLYRTE